MPKARAKRSNSQTYTIYLLKDNVKSVRAALDPEKRKEVTSYNLVDGLGFSGTLFVGNRRQYEPVWVKPLNPFLKRQVGNVRVATVSAALIVKYEKRIFAATFGWGKSFLRKSSWIRDFGLKITLNRTDPAKLRSIDTKTYEDIVVSTRKQTSRSSPMESFELDIARNLLRAVTGVSKDKTFFDRLAGADSIHLTTELAFQDFGDLLDELSVAYNDDSYKANFGWIDNVQEVDTAAKEDLDAALISALQKGETENMHLAPADIVEWRDIEGFNYTKGKTTITYPELELDDYLGVLGTDIADLSIEDLKRHNVRVRFTGSETFQDQWSVYECLVWDTEFKSKRYALFDERWFEVDQTYAKRVDKFVGGLVSSAGILPEGRLGDSEETYNKSVADNDPTRFALFDRERIKPSDAKSPIEFCDLMSIDRQLIHVKKRSSSATLSHLFSQGSVSAEVFLADAVARSRIRSTLKKLGKNAYLPLVPTDRPVASSYEVVYAVLTKNSPKWPPALPFFSGVNLMHHTTQIRNLGFNVSLHHVRER